VHRSTADLSWIYRAMRRIEDHLDESYYYEKL